MSTLPLDGIHVTDLTHYWSGPHATRILADYGADVTRVEYTRRMCVLRGAFVENERYNRHPRWHQINRNKRSITLDLKNGRDRGILEDLVRRSDIVTENSRTGVLARLGLAYEDLRQLKPDLIMLSMPACGSTGPWATYTGVGGSLEPLSGLQGLTAYGKNEKPIRVKEADPISGILGACAVLTALKYRQRSGRGQWIDLSQMEALTHTLMGEHLLEHVMNEQQSLPVGNRHPRHAPQGCYRCRGDDRWVTLTIRSDAEWGALCDLLGRPDWRTDPRFAASDARREHHDEIDRVIEGWTAERDRTEAMELLQQHGIPAGAVLDIEELGGNAHLCARGFFEAAADGTPGRYPRAPGLPAGCGPITRRRGPDLGADNEQVVTGMLGRPREDIPEVDRKEIGTAYDIE